MDRMQVSFEIEALEEGDQLDQGEVVVFLNHLNDLLSHADFLFRIGTAAAAEVQSS